MRAFVAVSLLFICFAFSPTAFAQPPNSTFVAAHYGPYSIPPPYAPMNNTLWYVLTVRQEDLDYYYASVATRDAAYYHNSGLQSITDSYGTVAAGVHTRYLYLGGSPVPANKVGTWTVNAFIYIQGEVCDPIQPEICWPTINCSRYLPDEPCFDEAQGYID